MFSGAVEVERGAALPSIDDALAEFVFVNLRRNGTLRDFRQRETIAPLHIESRVMAENERNALILPGILTGDRTGTWSLSVTANRRLTLRIDTAEREIYDVNLEDYH